MENKTVQLLFLLICFGATQISLCSEKQHLVVLKKQKQLVKDEYNKVSSDYLRIFWSLPNLNGEQSEQAIAALNTCQKELIKLSNEDNKWNIAINSANDKFESYKK